MFMPALPAVPSPQPWPQLNKAFQAEESPGVIYCISMQWFREWEAFVKGKDNGEWGSGPGSLRPGGTLRHGYSGRAPGDRGGAVPESQLGAPGPCLPGRFLVPPL